MVLPVTFEAYSISSGTQGFDMDYPPSDFSTYYSDGNRFYIGYTQHMTSTALGNALQDGLGVMLVQGFYSQMVTDYSGSGWAQQAISAAENIGYLKGCNLWLDLEGISNTSSQVITWANDWYDAVNNAGYVPGIYVGEPQPLSSYQLYYDLKFGHYWKSCSSSTPSVDVRGYQMFQTCVSSSLDTDKVEADNDGGLPIAERQVNQ